MYFLLLQTRCNLNLEKIFITFSNCWTLNAPRKHISKTQVNERTTLLTLQQSGRGPWGKHIIINKLVRSRSIAYLPQFNLLNRIKKMLPSIFISNIDKYWYQNILYSNADFRKSYFFIFNDMHVDIFEYRSKLSKNSNFYFDMYRISNWYVLTSDWYLSISNHYLSISIFIEIESKFFTNQFFLYLIPYWCCDFGIVKYLSRRYSKISLK